MIDDPASPRKSSPGHWLLAGALLAAYYGLALSATVDKCACADEIAHLTAGYSYWLFNDYRLQPENGNLPQRFAALPLLWTKPNFPKLDQPLWQRAHVWRIGAQFFYHSGNDAQHMLLLGRAAMGLFGVLLGLLVYSWSRRLFGPGGGLLSLMLFVICPNLLAHGPLINSDMAACLMFLAGLAAVWWSLQSISWPRLLVSGLVLGLLFVAKFSAVIILPVMILLAVLRVFAGGAMTVRGPRMLGVPCMRAWTFVLRRQQAELILGVFLVQALLVIGVIWAFYGFRCSAFNDEGPSQFHSGGWETMLDGFGLPTEVGELLQWARDKEVLPEAHLFGFAHSLRYSQARDSFLNGETGVIGWRHFFPYAFLVKTPIGTLIVLGMALIAWCAPTRNRSLRESFYATAPLWILIGVYWAIAISSKLNIGHRHILPTYPPMFILAGAAVRWLRGLGPWRETLGSARGAMAFLLLASLGWAAIDSLLTWPNYLAYFNQFVGGPKYGYRHLVDSSLDWGQDLPGLKTWLDRHDANRRDIAHLAYFGTGDPEYYGIQATRIVRTRDSAVDAKDNFTPGIYAISATYLHGVYLFPRRPWNELFEKEFRAAQWVQRSDDAGPASVLGLTGSPGAAGQFGALFGELGRDEALRKDRGKLANLGNYRFARLCTYLKQREPDDQVNYSIMIYRVDAEDLRKAFAPWPLSRSP